MAPNPATADRIDLPSDFANHLAAVGNLDTAPDTLAEYWARFAARLEASDHTLEPGDLYTAEPTRHEVHVNDRVRYAPCVLDALTAAVLDAQRPVRVRSVDPVTGTPVTCTVGTESRVTPESAVISFGIASSIPALEGRDESIFSWLLRADTPSLTAAFCQYINAFESEDSYERWATATDGETIPVHPVAAEALIRRYVDRD